MRIGLILALMATMLVCSASAGQVKEKLGPYDVSFDLNTTAKYSVSAEGPSNGVIENGVKFVEYNLSVDGGDSLLYLVLREYKINNQTDIDSNKTNINTVTGTINTITKMLNAAQPPNVKLYQLPIDGQTGALEVARFPSNNEVFACASYFLDSNSSAIKKTNCRVFSTYPWEITREMMYSLHVKGPA